MKKLFTCCAVLSIGTCLSHAQLLDLPPTRMLLDFDEDISVREFGVDAGATFGGDSSLLGLRLLTTSPGGVDLFAGLSLVELDDADLDGPAISAGLQFEIDSQLPFSTALLSKLAYGQLEGDVEGADVDLDLLEIAVLAVASGATSHGSVDWYVSAGIAYLDGDADTPGGHDVGPDSELEPQVGAGASCALTDKLRAWASVDYVDDTFMSLGLRHDF